MDAHDNGREGGARRLEDGAGSLISLRRWWKRIVTDLTRADIP